ncbi:hypothetical protein LUZ61_015878 [Rhynchospora tenuis]|uniref:F-box domain-containing protein n=1 Tax=Rhynchospora tenuis TaxID=198213 RepID=A0AAD5Z4H1_9POAL|nr:hypothetical protein LUZ61_015878 [Rhynchospora tenuis]
MEPVDRLSELSDELLTHVISFLSTKEAVQTSLLAKRYQNLWASVPVLDLDFDDFLPSYEIIEKMEEDEEGFREYDDKFMKFVNGVFEYREPLTLDAFKLGWVQDSSDPAPATTWLDTAAKLKPKIISAHIITENYTLEVPDSVFISESLEELELHLAYETIRPKSVNLLWLKRLTLNSVEIEDEVMKKLLSGSPALQELLLPGCMLNSGCISSGTLKRLVLDGSENEKNTPNILISIPSLEFLEVRSWAMGKLSFKDLKSLVWAHIRLEELSDGETFFLTGLSKVNSLELALSVSALKDMNNLLEKKNNQVSNL